MSRKWALLSRGNQRVECWVFSIWFVKSSKLSAWNEFMSFPGAPSAGPTSHNDREEGGREALVSVDHMSRRHFQHFQDLFPTGSRGFIRPSSSQQPGCGVDTTVLICFPGPPQDARLSSGPDCVHICHPTRLWRHDTKTPIGWNEARNQKSIHPNQRWVPNTDDRRHPLFISLQVTESWNSGELMLTQTEEESLLISCPQTSHTLILLLKLLRESLT